VSPLDADVAFRVGFCASVSSSSVSSSSESSSSEGGPGERRRRCFEGCGLAARASLLDSTAGSRFELELGSIVLDFGLRANFEYEEVLELPKLDVPEGLRGKTAGLRLLVPVLATTTGFLFPDL